MPHKKWTHTRGLASNAESPIIKEALKGSTQLHLPNSRWGTQKERERSGKQGHKAKMKAQRP